MSWFRRFGNRLKQWFSQLRNENANGKRLFALGKTEQIPKAEIAYQCSLALPGFDKKDVQLKVENGCLVVSAQKSQIQERKDRFWNSKTHAFTAFERRIVLPHYADENRIEARFSGQKLQINVGKLAGLPAPKRIAVS